MPIHTAQNKSAMRFVLITVFIYAAGFGIIMPSLPDLIQQLEGINLSDATRLGAWIGATYAIFQFALGPMLGNLGDRFGRRPIFLLSLFAFGFDFLLMGMAQSIVWLFIGRAIAGGLGALFGPANAAMADLSDEENRAASFGMVGAAFGAGFIIGPAMGGFIADAPLVNGLFGALGMAEAGRFLAEHSTRLPFFVAAGMAFANCLYGYFVFPETMPSEKRRKFEWHRANPLGALISLGKIGTILPVALIYFLWSFAGQIYPASWSFFAKAQYGWDSKMIGISLTIVGISMVFCQSFVIGRAVGKFGEYLTARMGMAFGVAGFMTVAFVSNGIVGLVLCLLMGLQGIAQPALNAIMSRRVPPDQQGELQGFNGSMAAMAFLLAQIIFNFTLSYFTSPAAPFHFAGAPFVIAGIFAAIALIMLIMLRETPAKS